MARAHRAPWRNQLIRIGLALVTLLVFAQAARFDFVRLDDPAYAAENPRVLGGLTPSNVAWAFTTTYRSNWHPLTWLSLMMDAELGGRRPAVFHGTNVVLHLANVLLLFQVFLLMTGLPWRSAFVAALFAVHPLHVESVAWVTERKDVLSTLFWLLTMLAYVRWLARPGVARYLLIVLTFVLGLLSKPMLVTLPLVLLVLDDWPLGRFSGVPVRRLLLEKAPLAFLSAASCAITLYAQAKGGAVGTFESFPLAVRAANAVVACATYMGKMLWPVRLAVPYPYDPEALTPLRVAACAFVLLLVSAVAIRTARSRPYLLAGWSWYLITLVPVIGLVQVGTQAMADRYTYVPLIGLAVSIAWGVPELLGAWGGAEGIRKALLPATAGLALAALAGLAFVQTGHWRQTAELATHALEVTKRNATAHNLLGLETYERGRPSEAIAHYRDALKLSSGYVDAHVNLAAALVLSGRFDEAESHYAEALRLRPGDADTVANLGILLSKMGRPDEARARLEEALRIDADNVLARKGLGYLLAQQGRNEEAEERLREVLRVSPGDAEARIHLATVLMRRGRVEEAEAQLVEALRINPEDPTAHTNLGILLVQSGRPAQAVAHFSEAARLQPGDEAARRNLERARALVR